MQTKQEVDLQGTQQAMAQDGYNASFANLFNKYGTDRPNLKLNGRIRNIQAYIQQAAEGGVHKRRKLVKQDVAQRLSDAKSEYRRERKAFGEELISQAFDRGEKKQKPTAHERLADIEEAKLRMSTMSTDQAIRQAQAIADATIGQVAVTFRNRYEGEALAARLRDAGENEYADTIANRLRQVPPGIFGDQVGAQLLDSANHYLRTEDRDAAYVKDEHGRRFGVSIDQLIDLEPLESVPE